MLNFFVSSYLENLGTFFFSFITDILAMRTNKSHQGFNPQAAIKNYLKLSHNQIAFNRKTFLTLFKYSFGVEEQTICTIGHFLIFKTKNVLNMAGINENKKDNY